VNELRAPFPWFGGKRRVADVVWRAFGQDVPNYIEPFAGSLAVLLARPGGPGKIETVNDRDRYLANFFRALKADPDAVARWADDPVNEADLHARHKWLVNQADFRERMHTDPDFYDVKIAGWWVWGICQWIGGGWCVEPNNHKHPKLDGIGKGVHSNAGHPRSEADDRKRPDLDGTSLGRGVHSEASSRGGALRGRPRPNLNGGQGIHAPSLPSSEWSQRPHLSGDSTGMGVHRKLPFLAVKADGACAGRGIHSEAAVADQSPKRQLPMLSVGTDGSVGAGGRGVHGLPAEAYSAGRRPAISTAGQGVHLPALGNDRGLNGVAAAPCVEWFRALQQRLRRVRVACGDWKRVLGDSVLGKGKNVGGRRPCAVFLDPPYSHEFRDPYLYSEDDAAISVKVREWAIEHGNDPDLRIALCGYDGEHEMPGWTVHAWKAARGYANADNENRKRERIWFSPFCKPVDLQTTLFGAL
jgi:hypothetical protein